MDPAMNTQPLSMILPTATGRMVPVKDPNTGMVTMVQENGRVDEEDALRRLCRHLVVYTLNTADLECAEVDALEDQCLLVSKDGAPASSLIAPAKTLLEVLVRLEKPYPHAERLEHAASAI